MTAWCSGTFCPPCTARTDCRASFCCALTSVTIFPSNEANESPAGWVEEICVGDAVSVGFSGSTSGENASSRDAMPDIEGGIAERGDMKNYWFDQCLPMASVC